MALDTVLCYHDVTGTTLGPRASILTLGIPDLSLGSCENYSNLFGNKKKLKLGIKKFRSNVATKKVVGPKKLFKCFHQKTQCFILKTISNAFKNEQK
jgi:hypothetical protein